MVKVRNRIGRLGAHRWRMRAWRSTERHIVIGGSPRSGTTLLRRTFDRHPGLCCGPESGLFLPGRVVVGRLAAGYGLSETEVRALLAECPSQGAFIDAVAVRYRALRGRPRWAEKTPLNIRYLDWISSRFPEARIVHVLRDGRDVVCSMREHPDRRWVDGRWVTEHDPRPVEEYARRWVADTEAGMRRRGDARYLEVRYEELVRDPAGQLERVLGFLGEPFDPAMLAADEATRTTGPLAEPGGTGGPGAVRRPDAAGPISTGSIGRWRRDLSGADRLTVERIAGARLAELGYLDV